MSSANVYNASNSECYIPKETWNDLRKIVELWRPIGPFTPWDKRSIVYIRSKASNHDSNTTSFILEILSIENCHDTAPDVRYKLYYYVKEE